MLNKHTLYLGYAIESTYYFNYSISIMKHKKLILPYLIGIFILLCIEIIIMVKFIKICSIRRQKYTFDHENLENI